MQLRRVLVPRLGNDTICHQFSTRNHPKCHRGNPSEEQVPLVSHKKVTEPLADRLLHSWGHADFSDVVSDVVCILSYFQGCVKDNCVCTERPQRNVW